MSTWPVNVAVRNLGRVRFTHAYNLDVKMQLSPGKRVIEVNIHHFRANLDDGHSLDALFGSKSRLHADLESGRLGQVLLGDTLHPTVASQTVTQLGGNGHGKRFTRDVIQYRRIQTADNIGVP